MTSTWGVQLLGQLAQVFSPFIANGGGGGPAEALPATAPVLSDSFKPNKANAHHYYHQNPFPVSENWKWVGLFLSIYKEPSNHLLAGRAPLLLITSWYLSPVGSFGAFAKHLKAQRGQLQLPKWTAVAWVTFASSVTTSCEEVVSVWVEYGNLTILFAQDWKLPDLSYQASELKLSWSLVPPPLCLWRAEQREEAAGRAIQGAKQRSAFWVMMTSEWQPLPTEAFTQGFYRLCKRKWIKPGSGPWEAHDSEGAVRTPLLKDNVSVFFILFKYNTCGTPIPFLY